VQLQPFQAFPHESTPFCFPKPERFFDALIDLFDLRDKKGYQLGLANAAIASRLLGGKTAE